MIIIMIISLSLTNELPSKLPSISALSLPLFLHVATDQIDDLQSRERQFGAGTEYGANPGLVEEVVVLGRDDSATDNQDVRPAQLGETGHQVGDESFVTRGQGTDTDTVNITVHSLLGNLVRG